MNAYLPPYPGSRVGTDCPPFRLHVSRDWRRLAVDVLRGDHTALLTGDGDDEVSRVQATNRHTLLVDDADIQADDFDAAAE